MSSLIEQRRTVVAELARQGKALPDIRAELNKRHLVNPKTGKGFSRQTIAADMKYQPLAETIGEWTTIRPQWQSKIQYHVSVNWKDLIFWDSLRRGSAEGFQISGPALCLPTAQTIAAYAYGRGISASLVRSALPPTTVQEAARILPFGEANGKPTQNLLNAASPAIPKAEPSPDANDNVAWTNLQLKTMIERNQGFFVATTVDEYCLGNQYIICNSDCTFSVASPETVTVEYDAADYRKPVRYIIRTKMQQATVEDVYTAEKRVITVQYYDERGTQTAEYENLIGRIPVVHWPNDRSANEIYGRPIYEGQLPLMRQYDDLMLNIIEGVKLLANPIPTFEGLDNITATKQANSTSSTYLDENGVQQTEWTMRIDRNVGLFLGKGGHAQMLSTPVGFTKDSLDTIRQCFLLYLNGVRIPELIWGGAISSSKAATESQMPPFIQYIEYRRLLLEGEGADPVLGIPARGGLLELIDVWLRMYKLLNPAIVVGPVQIKWPVIDIAGDQSRYLWATAMKGMAVITDETFVEASGMVTDAAAEVAAAAGQKARSPAFDSFNARLSRAKDEAARGQTNVLDPDGPGMSTDYVTPMGDQLVPSKHWEHPSPDIEKSLIGPLTWPGMV